MTLQQIIGIGTLLLAAYVVADCFLDSEITLKACAGFAAHYGGSRE